MRVELPFDELLPWAAGMVPALDQVRVAGSYTSAVVLAVAPPAPPAIRTLPLGSSVKK